MMTRDELAVARKWANEAKWTRLTDYGRILVNKLIDEVERLHGLPQSDDNQQPIDWGDVEPIPSAHNLDW